MKLHTNSVDIFFEVMHMCLAHRWKLPHHVYLDHQIPAEAIGHQYYS